MANQPPRTPSNRGIPGIVFPLAFVSVLLILLIAVFGALAFGVNVPFYTGDDEPEVTAADPAEALEMTRFVLRDTRVENGVTLGEAEITFRNTSDLPIEPRFQIYAQCNDNEGIISNIYLVSTGMDPQSDKTVVYELKGSGEPQCTDPTVSFSRERPE